MGATGFFIVVTAFGLGVLVLESVGLLVSDGADADAGSDAGAGADSADGGGMDDGDAGASHYLHSAASAYDGSTDPGIAVGPRRRARGSRRGAGVFRMLLALRMVVYFCCGFGPVGLASLLVGQTLALAVAAGAGAGVVIMAVAWLWIRLQRRELDSSIPDRDLVGAHASVTIAIAPGATGRVRIKLAQTVMDRYAVTRAPSRAIAKGEAVTITGLSGPDVVVQPAAPQSG